MRVYAVIDTNVLVSSLLTRNRDAATARVVDAVADGDIVPLYSTEILAEYADVLRRPKLPFSDASVRRIVGMIETLGISVNPSPSGEVLPDMDDLIFYEVAMERRDKGSYLVTGNTKHFPKRPFIVTPAEMMDILTRTSPTPCP